MKSTNKNNENGYTTFVALMVCGSVFDKSNFYEDFNER
jgi:hypothetical protein